MQLQCLALILLHYFIINYSNKITYNYRFMKHKVKEGYTVNSKSLFAPWITQVANYYEQCVC